MLKLIFKPSIIKILFFVFFLHTGLSVLFAQTVTYFVSSSLGDDSNDGSESHPYKTISRLKKKRDVVIKLKAGDVFFERLTGFRDAVIESYGTGEKPVLCGFRILRNPAAWSDNHDGTWSLDMSRNVDFSGYFSDSPYLNNVGFIYDVDNDRVYGHLVKTASALKQVGDFFTANAFSKPDADTAFGKLVLKYANNPSELGRLCFAGYGHGINNMTRCTIRNISVVGFACHGMCSLSHCTVDNCTLDLIGGAVLIGYDHWARYGNGIEFFVRKDKETGYSTVKNCQISRTYDCGTTIQGRAHAYDITFANNLFYQCSQAFEHWLKGAKGDDTFYDYHNCYFTDNVAVDCGKDVFSTPNKNMAALLSYEEQPRKSIIIHNNTFFGSNYYGGKALSRNVSKNQVYIFEDQKLNYYPQKGYPTIMVAQNDYEKSYRKLAGDNSRIHVMRKDHPDSETLRGNLLKTYHPIPLKQLLSENDK